MLHKFCLAKYVQTDYPGICQFVQITRNSTKPYEATIKQRMVQDDLLPTAWIKRQIVCVNRHYCIFKSGFGLTLELALCRLNDATTDKTSRDSMSNLVWVFVACELKLRLPGIAVDI